MNAKHLGDALDHWKGSIIQRMEGLLERIAVIPMITDDKPWDDKKIETYSRLLSVDRKLVMKVMEWNKTTRENRGDYFRNIHHRGDLFLDPD
ncbi:MAG: hypothetical protein MUO99_07250, partial [Dehalococcoidales bacterium]|nr:hypothetical protein [Dehalococcoidales bacterium]